MLRGDFFKVSKIVRWFMDQIRLIPVYRQRDGFSSLRENQALFQYFYDLLKNGDSISVMVEGSHDYRKRLRPVQRGTARIVIGTYKKYGREDITIVPIGLTYSNQRQFRSTAAVRFNAPIYLKDYLPLLEQNERKAMLAMTKEIQDRIRPCLVHVEAEEDDELVDQLIEMSQSDQPLRSLPPVETSAVQLEKEIALAEHINQLPQAEKEHLKSTVTSYFEQLQQHKLQDKGVAASRKFNLWNTLFVLLTAPIFLIGFVTHFIPIVIAYRVTNKMKKAEFFISMMHASSMFACFFYWLLVFIFSLIFFGWWGCLALLLPFLGYAGLLYRDFFLDWNTTRKFKMKSKAIQLNLVQLRTTIQAFRSSVATTTEAIEASK